MNFSTPTSNELNIFDSCESKYKVRPHFFRTITKTLCEISNEDSKKLVEKTIMYYKGAVAKINKDGKDDNNIIMSNNCSNIVDDNFSNQIKNSQ